MRMFYLELVSMCILFYNNLTVIGRSNKPCNCLIREDRLVDDDRSLCRHKDVFLCEIFS